MVDTDALADATVLPPVLIVHNRYRQPGGEDAVVQAEIDLLAAMGVHVETMIYASHDAARMDHLKKRPFELVFNRHVYEEVRGRILRQGIGIVHCHNLFPLLSTSVYSAAAAAGVPIVQTVHNYRMGCLNGLHLRRGQICERCRPGQYLPGMVLGCYRGSRLQSAALGLSQAVNHWRGTSELPTFFITPSAFLRQKLIAWGIPADKIVIKPHHVPYDPGNQPREAHHVLFVGRLSSEKGLDLLLDVWQPGWLPLVIVGEGPLRPRLEQRVADEHRLNVRFAGYQDRPTLSALLRQACCLVLPSLCFETFGLVLIEAYAHGVPVIATRLGAMTDIVRDGVTGFLFNFNDPADLANRLLVLMTDSQRNAEMGWAARRHYEALYSASTTGAQLRAIYSRAHSQSGLLDAGRLAPTL